MDVKGIILKKENGLAISYKEIQYIINGFLDESISEDIIT